MAQGNKKRLFFPYLNYLDTLIKSHLTVHVKSYFWTLSCISSIPSPPTHMLYLYYYLYVMMMMVMMLSSGQLQFLSEGVKNPVTATWAKILSSCPGLGPCPPGRGNSGESPNFRLIPMWGKGSHFSECLAGKMLVGILFCQLAHLPPPSPYCRPPPAPPPPPAPGTCLRTQLAQWLGRSGLELCSLSERLPSTFSHQQENNFPPQVFLPSAETKLPSAMVFHLSSGLMRKHKPSFLWLSSDRGALRTLFPAGNSNTHPAEYERFSSQDQVSIWYRLGHCWSI